MFKEEEEEFDDGAEDDVKDAEGKENEFAESYRLAGEETLEDDRTRSINLAAVRRRKEERERMKEDSKKAKEEEEARREERWKKIKSRTESYHI